MNHINILKLCTKKLWNNVCFENTPMSSRHTSSMYVLRTHLCREDTPNVCLQIQKVCREDTLHLCCEDTHNIIKYNKINIIKIK